MTDERQLATAKRLGVDSDELVPGQGQVTWQGRKNRSISCAI